MKEHIQKFREYLDYIEKHYDNVQKAWELINNKCCDKGFRWITDDFVWHSIDANIKTHDHSKLSSEEFTQYRQFFYPCSYESKDKSLFMSAWRHHKDNNPHHWQNWTKNYKNYPYADIFLIENIVDWVAMGFEFGDTAKSYYEKNKEEIDFPEWAEKEMYKIFDLIYENP